VNLAASYPALAIRRADRLDLTFQPWTGRSRASAGGDRRAFRRHAGRQRFALERRVLLLRDPQDHDDHFSAHYFETDSRVSCVAGLGLPRQDCVNGFGMARCAAATACFCSAKWPRIPQTTVGLFPSGTPDPNDLRGDSLDMADSVSREVAEETGLAPADYRRGSRHCVRTEQWIASCARSTSRCRPRSCAGVSCKNLPVRPSRS